MDINELSHKVIGCAYKVSNELGAGFLEKVYENALLHELKKAGLGACQQQPITVYYDSVAVGEYFADILVENRLIIELKTVRAIDSIHIAQCLNYLRATGMELALILNFSQSRLGIKRVIYTNSSEKTHPALDQNNKNDSY